MTRPKRSFISNRFLRFSLTFAAVFAIVRFSVLPAQAGFLVGNSVDVPVGNNDKIGEVTAVIEHYNANNDPNESDLTTGISLLYKSDDDATEVFDPNNGFAFFDDPNMATEINSEADLIDNETAYFTYSGPETLLYYSVKTGANDGFSLYTYMDGKNLLTIDGSTKEISHVSFWIAIPEPATLVLGISALACCLRRRL